MTARRFKPRRATDKPPYRVPSLPEISAIPWNGLRAASTFSGCGGSSLGYRMAGFRVGYASEFVEAARETYERNCPAGTVVDGRDIRITTAAEILEACGVDEGDLDLLDGSPPCASFSTSGKRSKGWGKEATYSDVTQRTDDLFFEFARILRGVRPRVFVAENVSGLVKGVSKGYFKRILAELRACRYRVDARLLDAQYLGVPQRRKRMIFVGVRDDLGIDPIHPSPLQYRYSLREAIPWIEIPTHDLRRRETTDEDLARWGLTRHQWAAHLAEAPNLHFDGYAIHEPWLRLKAGESSDRYTNLVRPDAGKPAPTILATGGVTPATPTHPHESRKFSIAELRRICAFPDDFALSGNYAQQWERLGRAVPPVMMSWIAATLRDRVLAR